jgi:threonine dehydrogenase-like Zn-dependent dehydrogenase
MRDVNGNQTERKAAVGDRVVVSHGRCCGKVVEVVMASQETFTMRCPCGSKLQVMQRDGYPFAA